MSAATAELAPAPSAAAKSACRNLIFDAIYETLDLTNSYVLSAQEAAYRGDELTIGVHIRQLRACVVELIKYRNDLAAEKATAV
jgi:hypothetical protein